MIVGGLRNRLLQDSVLLFLVNGLTTLGWLDAGRRHKPIRMQSEPATWQEPIEPNLVALDFLSGAMHEHEVGSPLTADDHLAHVEIYAESDSLGTDLSNDIRDLLRGRLTVIGSGGTIPLFDLRLGSPIFDADDVVITTETGDALTDEGGNPLNALGGAPIIGHAHVGAVSALRNIAPSDDAWLRHWYRVRCAFTDYYATSEE